MRGSKKQVGKFKKENKYGLGRSRNYVTMVYPDSASEDWLRILSDQHVSAFVSPLHDRDINLGGEPKKPHWHVMVMFDSVKTLDQARDLFKKINGVGCEKVASLRGCARYLCHLDNPEKERYKIEDVKCFGGANYDEVCSLVSDKYRSISEIIDFCEKHDVISFAELLAYCRNERQDWFRIICDSGTIVVKEYLKSRKWGKGYNNHT